MTDLSIIIVSFNTRQLLEDCLNSIYDQTKDIEIELIVVDNHSLDGSVEMLKRRFPQIVVIENMENRGFAAANNQAMKIAQGEYILLLNSDTIILENAIGKTLKFIQEHSDASIVGCRHLFPDRRPQPSCRSFPTAWNIFTEATFLYIPLKRTRMFGQYYLSYLDYTSVNKVDVVMGSFMLIRRSVIEAIGLFDEMFFFYSEETDFCYRAFQHGMQSYYFPGATIIHYGGASSDSSLWKFKNLHLAQFRYIDKHFTGMERFLMRGMKRIGIVLRIPVYLFAGICTLKTEYFSKCAIHISLSFQSF